MQQNPDVSNIYFENVLCIMWLHMYQRDTERKKKKKDDISVDQITKLDQRFTNEWKKGE